MSLSSVTRSAQRALAANNAKRGMFALVERRRSYMSVKDGHKAWSTYTPGIVSSVTRDGIAKEITIAGQSWPLKDRDWAYVMIDSAGRIGDPARVAGELVDEDGRAMEFTDRDEAVEAIRAAGGVQ